MEELRRLVRDSFLDREALAEADAKFWEAQARKGKLLAEREK